MNSNFFLTVVLGYSNNPEKYAYKAFHLLKEHHHEAIGFNPREDKFDMIPKKFHTLTLYINPTVQKQFQADILNLEFNRIIFNPGTENAELENECLKRKIEVVHGCTLVMLKTDQF